MAIIASLVVFIPGVALTTAFLELTEGQMIAGSSRLVWGGTQLGLLAFGIVAGVGAVGVAPEQRVLGSDAVLGWWAPWLGVLVFAVGVTVAHSAPPGAFALVARRPVCGLDRSGRRQRSCSADTSAASSAPSS